MVLARERQDLLDRDLDIAVWETLEEFSAGAGADYIRLDDWIEVLKEDDLGVVTTTTGIFDSIDLEFKEGTISRENI